MFEQDRLRGASTKLFERIERSCAALREKRMREGEGYTTDETCWQARSGFCEGNNASRFVWQRI